MDALDFFKARKRMCGATKCASCKLCHMQGGCSIAPENEEIDACKEAIAIVDQWAAEHPVKTRQSEFLKMFPDAPIYPDTGLVRVSPCQVDRALCGNCPTGIDCIECRKAFWLSEVEL